MARSRDTRSARGVRPLAAFLSPTRITFALGLALCAAPTWAQSVCDQTGGVAPTATGGSDYACGDGATASGGTSAAFGTQADASGANSSAIGVLASSSGAFSSAFGRSATASGDASTALGYNTSVTAANAVAIGANSVADQDNTVSVGAAGAERRITNVAAGTADTDGVNVSQLNDTAATTLQQANSYTDGALQQANSYTDQQIALLGSGGGGGVAAADLDQLRGEMNDRFAGVDARLDAIDDQLRKVDRRISRQGAMAAAQVHSLGMPDVGANWLGVGVGSTDGEQAFAVGFRRRFSERVAGSLGVSSAGNERSYGAGLGVTW
ncbi:YadA-like family protein [Stenotrophomonas sp. PS02289]|uniref:YadA-like family protein n=1 Tax=Stenotrophomonas sp. PS02289 TaxID=2991422 RepID=UPI00249B8D81|nr:YadA-like family protein [Stenotrophomonas sp. PS02289]